MHKITCKRDDFVVTGIDVEANDLQILVCGSYADKWMARRDNEYHPTPQLRTHLLVTGANSCFVARRELGRQVRACHLKVTFTLHYHSYLCCPGVVNWTYHATLCIYIQIEQAKEELSACILSRDRHYI